MSIYVEARIRGAMDDVWRLTQTPDLHGRWDLRFTSITDLESARDAEPHRFRYATRIGLGVTIEGWGESVGVREGDGTRTSALRFGSDDPRSLIRSGSGYWKYVQLEDGVRFITGYDYEVRWGAIGRIIDRLMFRPLIGWATAWSFDRLRLWIEEDVEPRQAARQALIHGLAAVTVAFVWMWHGLVPKLAGPHPDELALLREAGVAAAWERPVVLILGALELAFGLAFLPLARRKWPWQWTMGAMIVATFGVLVNAPARALAAFNPVTLNLLLAVVAAIGLLSLRSLPSARRCLRSAPSARFTDDVS
ncbi:MAG: DoxX-like family protein [Ardenticatenales bacterium]